MANGIAIWGAALSSILGALKICEFWRSIQRVDISGSLIFSSSSDYGSPISTEHGEKFVFIELVITNRSDKAIQAFRTVVVTGSSIQQITTKDLPFIIQSHCRQNTRLQKEWIDNPKASSLGIMLGNGNVINLPPKLFSKLALDSRSLPTEFKQYKKKDNSTTDTVWAFKCADPASVINRGKEKRTETI